MEYDVTQIVNRKSVNRKSSTGHIQLLKGFFINSEL